MNIVFTPLLAGKPWNGATIYEQALGGSEACVAYLARELARRGHNIKVYTHGQEGTFEGVLYEHTNRMYQEQWDGVNVHVSSRWPEVLRNSTQNVLKVLWLHDMPSPQPSAPIQYVVCISEFQKAVWNFGPDSEGRVFVIGDGVDTSNFSGYEDRSTTDLVWISNPDRGLWLASKVFVEEVIPRWPDLRLHVYGRAAVYGWGPSAERLHLPFPEWCEGDDPPIVLHRPLPRLALARELMRAWAVWYPTFWPETFCMAALEAQCAGTPVITTPVGALQETVKGGVVQHDVVNAISQLRNVGRWNKLSEAGKAHSKQFSWAAVAVQWEKMFEEGLTND